MVDGPPGFRSTSGSGGAATTTDEQSIPFILVGEFISFTPTYYPERIRPRKERNLDRSQNFCRGEDVVDNGAKNRDIHVNGIMVGDSEKSDFNFLLDSGEPFDMSSTTWSGEVFVSEGDYEGPTGWDPRLDAHQYEYTLDLVATGAEQRDATSGNGIVASPDEFDPETIGRTVDALQAATDLFIGDE